MVVWYSLKTQEKYALETLEHLLKKLVHFHAYNLSYYSNNAGNQVLIDTDRMNEDYNWKLELLREQFEMLKTPYYNTLDLAHIFTISSCDESDADSYRYVDDPKKAKKRAATRHFNQLVRKYPQFNLFELQYNYEY